MIIYNGKESLTDFDLYVASKELPTPQRKEMTESVPLMSGIWDFSFSDGVDSYEPVTLKYTFDVIADSKKELSNLKVELIDWLHNIGTDNVEVRRRLYDTDISETEYYEVYFARANFTEEDLQGLLSVEFVCYPFRKTERRTRYFTLTSTAQNVQFENAGYRPIYPIFTVTGTANISDGVNSYSISSGTYKDFIPLKKGSNTFTFTGTGTLSVTVWEERL